MAYVLLNGGLGPTNHLEKGLARVEADAGANEVAKLRSAEGVGKDGLVVAYATVDSPLGPLVVAATSRGLLRISYEYEDAADVLEELAYRISPRVLEAPARLGDLRRELDEYFEGRRSSFECGIDWSLTSGFTQRVLKQTARVPYGSVTTYKDVARKAGSPRGARAAGNALGSNPIPIVVPCHRVVHSGGGLGGYTSGLHRKKFLLELEGALT